MRLFIAVDLPMEVKNSLEALKPFVKGKIVKKEQMHITLKFLGDVDDALVPRIIRELSEISFPAFRVKLTKAGAFPDETRARVIWVGAEPEEPLAKVKALVDQTLPKFVDDKPFKGHITLARCESDDLRDEIKILNSKLEKKEFLVSKITLYKSILTPQGPVYEKLV